MSASAKLREVQLLPEGAVSAKGTNEYIIVNGIPIAPPCIGQDEATLLDPAMVKALEGRNQFTIKQRVNMLEAVTGGCFEASNVYDISDTNSGEVIMAGVERSPDFTRFCCAPMHTLTVEFKNGIGQDLGSVRSLKSLREYETVMTMEREGCFSKPCLCCPIFMPGCADGMTLHAGTLAGEPGKTMLTGPAVMGYAQQPSPLGGVFTPTLNIMDRGMSNQYRPVARVEGPTFFGGCSEMCMDSNFTISAIDQEHVGKSAAIKSGDMGHIVKRKPASFGDALKEAFTDSDQFTIDFSGTKLTPQQKALMISSLVLIDYMFFELDNGMIGCSGTKLKFTCCLCYCLGCLYPCSLKFNTRLPLEMIFKPILAA